MSSHQVYLIHVQAESGHYLANQWGWHKIVNEWIERDKPKESFELKKVNVENEVFELSATVKEQTYSTLQDIENVKEIMRVYRTCMDNGQISNFDEADGFHILTKEEFEQSNNKKRKRTKEEEDEKSNKKKPTEDN